MDFDGFLFGATPQATVDPADVFLSQSPRQPTQIPHILTPGDTPDSYGTSKGPQLHIPIWPAVPMSQLFNDAARPFIGPIRRISRTFRGFPVANTVPTMCQWRRLGFPVCGQYITQESLSEHLVHHGIYKMHKNVIVQCCWQGCGTFVKRQSMTRHCREVHLGVKRKSPGFDAFVWDAFVVDVL